MPGACGGQEGSASPGTRVGTTGRWRWMWVLGPATDFTCSRLPLQGSGLSAGLNLHLPKAHTSSRVGFALAPLLLPLFLHPFHTHFSISSHYPTLSWAHGGGGARSSNYAGIQGLTQQLPLHPRKTKAGSIVRLSVHLQQNPIPAPQGSHLPSPLINALPAICQPESRNSRK